jgi:midasin (ATPase involved in ribosome maturation)
VSIFLIYKLCNFLWLFLLFCICSCGKTTLCQLIAHYNNTTTTTQEKMYTISCHEHTEAADFIGRQRPRIVTTANNNDENNLNVSVLYIYLCYLIYRFQIMMKQCNLYGPTVH